MDDWLNHAPCGYLRLSPQSQILYANQTLVRWLGLPPDDLPGRPVADILTVSSRIFYLGNILPLLQQGNAAQEAYLELISPDQTRLPMLLNAHPSRTDDGIVYEIALLPMMRRNLLEEKWVSARLQAENQAAQLTQLAITDALTGLANRRRFNDELEAGLKAVQQAGTSMALLIMDIDYFKPLNDQYGHDAGDKALTEVAALLQKGLRDHDLVARVGGEEFAILLPRASASQALFIAERLRQQIADHKWRHGEKWMKLTMSVGIAQASATDTPQTLYQRADQAMYMAKRTGRNRVVQA